MVKHRILDIDPSEIVLHEIPKHPVGLWQIYAMTVIFFILDLFALFFLVSNEQQLGLDGAAVGFGLLSVMLGFLILIIAYIAVSIYTTNELVVTNENILLIKQNALFDRKVSQLNLAKIQDVSVDQDGIVPTMLNYGTITIETAGEASNYTYTNAPDPIINAKHIIEAHEEFLKSHSQPRYQL